MPHARAGFTGVASASRRVRRSAARFRHDRHGARPRARLLRRHRGQPDQSRHDHRAAVLHTVGHAHLRAGVLPSDRNRRVFRDAPAIGLGYCPLPADTRRLADRAGRRRRAVSRAAVQRRLPRHRAERPVGVWLVDDCAVGGGAAAARLGGSARGSSRSRRTTCSISDPAVLVGALGRSGRSCTCRDSS